MRRKERERAAEFALQVFANAEFATLSTVSADGQPYGVPLSQIVMNGAIYFHCALEGLKLDNITANPKVSISAVSRTKLRPEKYTTEYDSAIAFGTCSLVADVAEKREAMLEICRKFAPENMERAAMMIERSMNEVGVGKVTIESITGKSNDEE